MNGWLCSMKARGRKNLKYNTVWYSNPTLGYRPEGIEIRISKRSLHSHVPCRITYNSHNLNAILEKAMAPHSNTLAWKIPWMEEPGGLQSMGSLRVGQLSDFAFTFHFHALEKEMATHSSVLAWRIPGTGEPGGLPSMGSHRVGHDWSDLAAAAAAADIALKQCSPDSCVSD